MEIEIGFGKSFQKYNVFYIIVTLLIKQLPENLYLYFYDFKWNSLQIPAKY